jgi:hypothetical protein
MRPIYWRRDRDGRSTWQAKGLTHRAYSPNACQMSREGGAGSAWWLRWMAEESACPPLASTKHGSEERSELWQAWGPSVHRASRWREVKAYPEMWSSLKTLRSAWGTGAVLHLTVRCALPIGGRREAGGSQRRKDGESLRGSKKARCGHPVALQKVNLEAEVSF